MKITINEIPPSINKYMGRKNVWQYRADKERWTQMVYLMALYAKPTDYITPEKAVVTITYYFKTKARHDPDNNSGKLFMDGLTKAGIIKDDSFDYIELVLRGRYDKTNPRTEIEVEEQNGY
jgi:crossover junction endodeoxyribonuclease RusA